MATFHCLVETPVCLDVLTVNRRHRTINRRSVILYSHRCPRQEFLTPCVRLSGGDWCQGGQQNPFSSALGKYREIGDQDLRDGGLVKLSPGGCVTYILGSDHKR
ncbi:hypothetical protein CEXT_48571 [Caerostris extrusa]|uniref:Uncharacterized protein n=1 Tax=Caerostris extrusa TaxID=172846 RepID=A0AAV4N2Z1_CAEEX|nr:hypothetical protein CEXT_48571 [Caerostris extrusa]